MVGRSLLYIMGIPGAGKSALTAELVAGRRRHVLDKPCVHTMYEDGLVQLGREREGRSGTDCLSMSVQPLIVAALDAGLWPRLIAEGDRLTNESFFEAARNCGYYLTIVYLNTPLHLAAARRAIRGSTQNEAWVRGRITKVRKLASVYRVVELDGSRPVKELAARLATHPVLEDIAA